MKKLIREIHRRSIWQVLGIYVGGGWAALQVVDLLTANVGLPGWFPGFALALLILGLPVVLATAIVQEGRPAGAAEQVGEASARESSGAHRRILTWRNALLGGVGAFALWGIVAAGWVLFGGERSVAEAVAAESGAARRSIAVLPFATRSADPQDQYFAEGMHDDLLTQLAKIDSLTVISRTSVMQYAETTKDIRTIGRELGVATVLEGGIQRAGDKVRVNVQLIDAGNDRHLWAETYDEELTAANLFAIQTDLAREIAAALSTTLSPAVEERIEALPTESLEAYDLYIRGRYISTHQGIGEDLDEARALYEQAIAADSGFASAWAALASVDLSALNWGQLSPAIAIPRAAANVERALSLDPNDTRALLAKAGVLSFQGRMNDAERTVLRVLELSPGSAEALSQYGVILGELGRFEEAIAVTRRAIAIDPLDYSSRHLLADRLYFAGSFDEAIAESRKTLVLRPDDWYGHYNLGWSLAAAGEYAEACTAFYDALSHTDENAKVVQAGLAYAFAAAGQPDSALAHLTDVDPAIGYDYALVMFEIGRSDEALVSLEAVLAANPRDISRVMNDPLTADMRADPRFAALLRRFEE